MPARPVLTLLTALATTLALNGCGLTEGIQTLSGEYEDSFETSSFVPEGDGCPARGRGFWLETTSDFMAAVKSKGTTGPVGSATGTAPTRAFVRIELDLSKPGSYGHLGQYSRKAKVISTISVSATNCPFP